jgi:hypothetical protein
MFMTVSFAVEDNESVEDPELVEWVEREVTLWERVEAFFCFSARAAIIGCFRGGFRLFNLALATGQDRAAQMPVC